MHSRLKKAPALAVLAMGLSGCVDYAIETTLDDDGGGRRNVTVEVTDPGQLEGYGLSAQEFRQVMGLSSQRGWDHEVRLQNDGDTVHVFHQEQGIQDLASWSGVSGQIKIEGAPPSRSDSNLGYLRLGDLQFHNRLWVRVDPRDDETAYFYQEHFLWDRAVDALVEFILGALEGDLEEAYPRLSDRQRGEMVGFARASLWTAMEDGFLDADTDDQDRIWRQVGNRIGSQAVKVLRTAHPEVSDEEFREYLCAWWEGSLQGEFEEDFDRILPGLSLAINTSITFQLTMPGRIVNTNAHERNGNTLSWDFSPADSFEIPIVLVAESLVGGGDR